MPHKADKSFFDKKKPWSIRKDTILADYLAPFLPKIATQRKPILLVDAFAGQGRFNDGSLGSPLIICNAIVKAQQTNPGHSISCICIEKIDSVFKELQKNLLQFPFATAKEGSFIDHISEIAEKAKTHNLFLYADPFTVEGLVWDEMDRLFQMISREISIEFLLNLNVASFMRRGLAALNLHVADIDPAVEDAEEIDAPIAMAPSANKLDRIVGGDWWQSIARERTSFEQQIAKLTEQFCSRLRSRFNEVCAHPVKALPHHTIPKYTLVFASRHPHALRLMNDAMCKSRIALADIAKPTDGMLFETRSTELVPDTSRIRPLVLKHAAKRQMRGDLIIAVIRDAFCDFNSSEIRGEIEALLKNGVMKSETGRVRINDEVEVWIETKTH